MNKIIATLANTASTYSGIGKDQRAFASNNMYNNMAAQSIGTSDFILVPTQDAYGNTTYTYQKRTS
jgi:hypothetical protein